MSKERMVDLKVALERDGWQVGFVDEGRRKTDDLFEPENEIVRWSISKNAASTPIELVLEFHLFGGVGERTRKLKDIFYCLETRSGIRLYFSKISSDRWQEDVKSFVRKMSDSVPSDDQEKGVDAL